LVRYNYYYLKELVGTPFYIAPEICNCDISHQHNLVYTPKSDYYALAIILWEIFENNAFPYQREIPDLYKCSPYAVMHNIHKHNLRPEFVNINPTLTKVKSLIQALWHADPQQRPDLSNVFSVIEQIQL